MYYHLFCLPKNLMQRFYSNIYEFLQLDVASTIYETGTIFLHLSEMQPSSETYIRFAISDYDGYDAQTSL